MFDCIEYSILNVIQCYYVRLSYSEAVKRTESDIPLSVIVLSIRDTKADR